jgi:endonuclease YncB( thermonuclease family)
MVFLTDLMKTQKLATKSTKPMAYVRLIVTRLWLLLCVTANASPAVADVAGRVIGVSDGDTLTLLTESRAQIKVRLAGIDSPEGGQAFGQPAKRALSDCAFGKHADVEGSKIDRYGRLIGKVLVNGVDCNLRQVNLGLAWHYRQYALEQSPQDRTAYANAEDSAKAKRRGLWHDGDAVPPWDYRKSRRSR